MEDVVVDESYWPSWPDNDHRDTSEVSLQDARRDTWIGLPVVVVRGKSKGNLARVLGTGSGWVQIRQSPPDGSDPLFSDESTEASKRAVDLYVVRGYEDPDRIPQTPLNAEGGGEDDEDPDLSDENVPVRMGLIVRVTEGNYQGRLGRVVGSTPSSLWVAVKNATSVVEKLRGEVEIATTDDMVKGEGDEGEALADEDAPTLQDSSLVVLEERAGRESGRSSRLVSRKMEIVGKRVQLQISGQTGSVSRLTASGSFVVVLDDDGTEVTKRKDELQVLGDAEDDDASQQGGAGGDNESERGGVARVKQSERALSRSSPKGERGVKPVRKRNKEKEGINGSASGAVVGTGAEGEAEPVTRGKRAIRRNTRNGTTARRPKENTLDQKARAGRETTKLKRQEFIVGFVQRMKERMEKSMGTVSRPNLSDWLEAIQGDDEDDDDDGDEDAYIPLVYDPSVCSTCLVEMAPHDSFCWNPACDASPVYNPRAAPLGGSDAARTSLAFLQSPRKPGFIDYASFHLIKGTAPGLKLSSAVDEEDEKGKISSQPDVMHSAQDEYNERRVGPRRSMKRRKLEQEMVFSPLVSYDFRAPSAWLGTSSQDKPAASSAIGTPAVPTLMPSVGFFGGGWRDDLVFEEPGLRDCPQAEKSDSALDYRWKRGLIV